MAEYTIDDLVEELEAEEQHEEEHEEIAEEAEQKAEREDKVAHKIRKSYEELDAKMDAIELSRIMEKFDESADEDEQFVMATVRADLKDPEQAAAAIAKIKARAAELRTKREEREAELMKQAEERASKAWGVGPVGKPAAPADAEKELMERINKGDMSALTESVIGVDLPF